MLEITPTMLQGVKLIKKPVYPDHRGLNCEIYAEEEYRQAGITINFPVQTFSHSRKGVLRGLHGDNKTWKLISCIHGRLYCVVLNYDSDSDQFGEWDSFYLSPESGFQILIPPKFLNGHVVLTDDAVFHYCKSEYYKGQDKEISVAWDDPRFKIAWPIDNPILSARDGGKL